MTPTRPGSVWLEVRPWERRLRALRRSWWAWPRQAAEAPAAVWARAALLWWRTPPASTVPSEIASAVQDVRASLEALASAQGDWASVGVALDVLDGVMAALLAASSAEPSTRGERVDDEASPGGPSVADQGVDRPRDPRGGEGGGLGAPSADAVEAGQARPPASRHVVATDPPAASTGGEAAPGSSAAALPPDRGAAALPPDRGAAPSVAPDVTRVGDSGRGERGGAPGVEG
ncbi:MAG: hypothetical protein RLZZ383_341, partial [Pseudomonadota bacterium]